MLYKNINIKKITFLIFLFFFLSLQAQEIPNAVEGFFKKTIVPLWPYAVGLVAVIGLGFSSEHLFGDNKDTKKAFIIILKVIGWVSLATIAIGIVLKSKITI